MPTDYDRSLELKLDGEVLAQDKYRLGNARLHQPMYGHHEFEIEIFGVQGNESMAALAGNPDLEKLLTKVGAKLELTAAHAYITSGRSDKLAFTGLVTAVEAHTDFELGFAVLLRGHSPTIRLDDVPRNRVLNKIKVSDWFSAVVGDRGLSAKVDASSEVFEQLVQRNENDWQFALRVLGQAGLHVYYDGKELHAAKKVAGATTTLAYDQSESGLLEFRLESIARPGKMKTGVWGEKDAKKVLKQSSASASSSAKATHPFTKTAESASGQLFGVEGNFTPVQAPGSASLLDADAASVKGAWISSLTKGRGRSDNHDLAPGKTLKIEGIGAKISGSFIVTTVTHEWSDERLAYSNSFECVPDTSLAPPRVERAEAPRGIWTARVTSLKDPEKFGRVQVQCLDFEEGQWVRLSSFYLNDAGGFVCYPEIGDEVLVGFVDGDDRFPVILGSVLHPKALGEAHKLVASELEDESNDIKLFRTRSGHLLQFDETKDRQKIELKTPTGELLLTMDATSDKVKFEIVSKGEVSVTAEKTCTVTAKEDVTIKTDASANVTAKKDFKVTADGNVTIEAKGNLTMKGGAKAVLEGGSETEVKGAGSSVKAAGSGVDVKGPMIKLN